MKDVEMAIKLKPDWSKGYQRKGNVFIEVEKLEEAEEQFRIALEKDPSNDSLKTLVGAPKEFIRIKKEGNEKLTAGKMEDAIKIYTEGIKLKILTYIFYSNRSAAYFQLGKYQEALNDAEEAIKLKPKFGKAHLRKGSALFAQKKLVEAEIAFQQGLKVDKNNTNIQKQLDEVQKIIKTELNFVHVKSDSQFHEILKSYQGLIVTDFYATWCGPCKHIAPFFEDLSKKYKDVMFLKVDVDQLQSVAVFAKINCMPTFHYYKGGKSVHVIEGADAHQMIQKIEKLK